MRPLWAYCTEGLCELGMDMSSAVASRPHRTEEIRREVVIGRLRLAGDLWVPGGASALVVFAHGSGSSRLSPRNTAVARRLNQQGIATLLFDLLTADEELDRANVFDIPLLAERLVDVVGWVNDQRELAGMRVGFFGASTGAAAALVAAAKLGPRVGAVVSRGGRPDLAGTALDNVTTPTLFIIGGRDAGVIELNERAYARLRCQKAIEVVPGATHLFPEPGAMDAVITLAGHWFQAHLAQSTRNHAR
jgi:putative phosphoribosyl transferase